MAFAFSPDESRIAYVRRQDQPRRLIIRNLSNGTEKSIGIDLPVEDEETYTQAGWIDWSPDGNELIYHTEVQEMIQAVHVDIPTMKQKVLFEFLDGKYWFDGWTLNGGLRFIQYPKYEVVEINVQTGEMTSVGTVTPTP